MNYPTMEEVEKADWEQLCRWHRFLEPPGASEPGESFWNFVKILKKEQYILSRIDERLKETGGFTPEISKKIGWKEECKKQ